MLVAYHYCAQTIPSHFLSSTFALTYVKWLENWTRNRFECLIFLLAFFKFSPHFASLRALNLNPEKPNIKIYVEKGRKHYGKRRKGWLSAFSTPPTMFSKALFLRVVKSQDCVVKG